MSPTLPFDSRKTEQPRSGLAREAYRGPGCRALVTVAPWSLIAALLGVGAVGCTLEDVDSAAIRTFGIHVDVVAQSPGDGTTLVTAELAVGGRSGTKVDLTGSDELRLSVAGESQGTLSRTSDGHYERRPSTDAEAEFVVEFNRGDTEDPSFLRVNLPPPYAMRWPDGSTASPTFERGVPVSFTWSPAVSGIIDWQVRGSCIWSESGNTLDDGELTLPAETFRVRGNQVGEACTVQVRLDRRATGTADIKLAPSSTVEALQTRALTFTSVPAAGEVALPTDAGAP